MPHITLTINGRILLDDELDKWQQEPPEAMLQYLKPATGSGHEPWVRPAMVMLADAALAQRPAEIHVTTEEGGSFEMAVRLPTPTGVPDLSVFGVQKMNMP